MRTALTYDKVKTLLIFVHSRLSGKYANYEDVYSKPVIEDKSQAQKVINDLKELEATLEAQGFTMDSLNNAPYTTYIDMITHYYKVALSEMVKNSKEVKMLKVATLFSGIGTPEQSLKHLKVEHETVFACEIDKYARNTYLANNQEPKTFYDDVYNIDGNKYKDQIDILIGGSPCQSFSIAGKRMGTSCPKGELIYEYFRIVEELKPKVFVYENVKGFLSIDKGETFKNFVQSFKELGYTTYHQVLNTKDYGVPQNRERIYIVGFKDNVDFHFQEKQELKLRLKDMLEDNVDSKYLLNHELVEKYLTTGTASNHKGSQAGKVADENDETFWTVNAGTHGYSMGYIKLNQTHTLNIKGNDSIKRIYSSDGLCPSLTTMQGGHREPKVAIENTEVNYIFRKLTPRECFRLQGFDDSFIFPPKMSDSQLYKQAGNGMSRNILDMLFVQIFKSISIEELTKKNFKKGGISETKFYR